MGIWWGGNENLGDKHIFDHRGQGRAGAAGYMQSLKINKMKQFTQFRQTSSKVITLKQTQTGHIV